MLLKLWVYLRPLDYGHRSGIIVIFPTSIDLTRKYLKGVGLEVPAGNQHGARALLISPEGIDLTRKIPEWRVR